MSVRLRISEIFYSIQGEARTVGYPTVFIRLTGCPLRCVYCDTPYAFQGGKWWGIEEIMQEICRYSTRFVTVTGGEPLAQQSCLTLLTNLVTCGYQVSVETSGAMDISAIDPRVSKVVDIKTPGSGEEQRNLYSNFNHLTAHDQLKIVICSRSDYIWAKAIMEQYSLVGRCEVFFSPVHPQLPPKVLADWILEDRLTVRLQVQLHKIIWDDVWGR